MSRTIAGWPVQPVPDHRLDGLVRLVTLLAHARGQAAADGRAPDEVEGFGGGPRPYSRRVSSPRKVATLTPSPAETMGGGVDVRRSRGADDGHADGRRGRTGGAVGWPGPAAGPGEATSPGLLRPAGADEGAGRGDDDDEGDDRRAPAPLLPPAQLEAALADVRAVRCPRDGRRALTGACSVSPARGRRGEAGRCPAPHSRPRTCGKLGA